MLGGGAVVICHDAALDHCSDRTGKLADLTKANLQIIDAGSWFGFDSKLKSEPIHTLEELISLTNSSRLSLNLEIKSCADSSANQDAAGLNYLYNNESVAKRPPSTVSSFDYSILAEFKQRMPNIPIACLFEHNKLSDNWPTMMEEAGATYLHPREKNLTQATVKEAKKRGYGVNVWTVNNLDKAEEFFSWGVDGICTDIPQQFSKNY